MEKEQKKLLLVAVSVGVFLLVTVTVAIIMITQRTQPQEASTWTAPSPVLVQPVAPPPVIDTPQIIEFEDSSIAAVTDINNGDQLIIQIPSPTTAAVPDTPEIVSVAPRAAPVAPAAPKPAAAAPAKTQKPAAQTASRAVTPSKSITDYWIQTGAFSARVRAEDAKDLLNEKGLVSIIENREVNGQIWYRVRLGPYTSQKEADYWLALVKSIDGFGESQVRQTTRVQ